MPPPTRPAASPPTPLSNYRRTAPLWQQLALGGASCGFATTFTHPLDTVKLRLQLQGAFSRHAEPRYTGLLTGLSAVARNEGVFALYQGLSPAIMRAATYSATRLGMYEPLRTSFARAASQDQPSFGVKVSAAVCSGAMGAFVGNPCELIKVRMQQGEVHRYRNVFHGLFTIVRHDGIAALWVGIAPAAMRAALLTSSQLATYDHAKHYLKRVMGLQEGLPAHVGAAMTAGLITTTMSTPPDLVKSVVMSARPPLSLRVCITKIFREEGIRGFMRGWTANYVRLGPHTLLSVVTYESLRTALGWGNL